MLYNEEEKGLQLNIWKTVFKINQGLRMSVSFVQKPASGVSSMRSRKREVGRGKGREEEKEEEENGGGGRKRRKREKEEREGKEREEGGDRRGRGKKRGEGRKEGEEEMILHWPMQDACTCMMYVYT